jgi:DNA invertase Pin-like site-specific DNA recombinase
MTTAVGYARVSTVEQESSGLGLEAQRRALWEESERRGWSMLAIHEDVASGKTRNGRRGLVAALDAVDLGEADVLLATRIDRLSRSLRDLIELMDRSVQEGWALVTLDLRVDTTTPHGKAMARMAGVFAELERDLIAERTRVALAVKKAQGAKLGRPVTTPQDVRRRIQRMRARSLGWTAIARKLNGDGVATAQGGKRWYPSTVRAMFTARQAANRRPRAPQSKTASLAG